MIVLAAGVKRKHVDQTDDQVNKHIHLDPESSDGFADLATLVNMSSAVSLAVSQVTAPKTMRRIRHWVSVTIKY